MKKHVIYILFIGATSLILGCFAHREPVGPYDHTTVVPSSYGTVMYGRPYYYKYYGSHHNRPYYRHHKRHNRRHYRHHRSAQRHHKSRVHRKQYRKRYTRPKVKTQRRKYVRPKRKLIKRTVRRHYNKNGKLRKRVTTRRFRRR